VLLKVNNALKLAFDNDHLDVVSVLLQDERVMGFLTLSDLVQYIHWGYINNNYVIVDALFNEIITKRSSYGNPLTKEWQESCLKVLLKENCKNGVNENYKFAKGLTWESQAEKFLKMI
jgi:hypothetical protein